MRVVFGQCKWERVKVCMVNKITRKKKCIDQWLRWERVKLWIVSPRKEELPPVYMQVLSQTETPGGTLGTYSVVQWQMGLCNIGSEHRVWIIAASKAHTQGAMDTGLLYSGSQPCQPYTSQGFSDTALRLYLGFEPGKSGWFGSTGLTIIVTFVALSHQQLIFHSQSLREICRVDVW